MINSFPPVASSVVFVMHASDVAKYLSRNMDLLPHSQAIRKMVGLMRKPGVVRFDTPMIDCLKLMVKKRSDALAVVNEEGEFCGEVRIKDLLQGSVARSEATSEATENPQSRDWR